MEAAGPEQSKPQSSPGRWPKGTSGNPSGRTSRQIVAERAAELFDAMSSDFGELSAVDRTMLHQACLLLARSERASGPRAADASIRMSGEARRLLELLRRHAAPAAKPAVQSYAELAAEVQRDADAKRAIELAADPDDEDEAAAVEAASVPADSENESSELAPAAAVPSVSDPE